MKKESKLNNYCLYLMLIAYMQSIGELPNLQETGEEQLINHQIHTNFFGPAPMDNPINLINKQNVSFKRDFKFVPKS